MSTEGYAFDTAAWICGAILAERYVAAMPAASHKERVARADALVAATRLMWLGEWRPAFPFVTDELLSIVTG